MSKSTTKRNKQNMTKPPSSEFPTPFEKASASLEPFLAQLDPKKIYITHIDRHKIEYKKYIFTIPVILNAVVAALLAWRAYVAIPKYFSLIQTFLGYASSATVDVKSTTRQEQIWIIVRRTLMMLADFVLFRFIGPWPWSFFLERPANPVTWRWKLGFQLQEVIVRVCRNWEGEDLMSGTKRGMDNPFFKTRIVPAVEAQQMEKTGYLMMDGSWDLDFGVMQDAHVLLKQEKINVDDLDNWVFAYLDGTGWLAWRFEKSSNMRTDIRKKMETFKEMLTKMGKEDLFWRWQEILEEERNADGGFTPETQQKVATRVSEEFRKAGVDFEQAIQGVGVLDELQGGSDRGKTD